MSESMLRHKRFLNELARVNFFGGETPPGTPLFQFHRGAPRRRMALAGVVKEFRRGERSVSGGLLVR